MGPGRGARSAHDRGAARRRQPVPHRHEGGILAALHRGRVGERSSPAHDGRLEAVQGAGRDLFQANGGRHASPLRRRIRLHRAARPTGEDVPGRYGSRRQECDGRHEAGARGPVRGPACKLGHQGGRQAHRARPAGVHPVRLPGGAPPLEPRLGVSRRSTLRDYRCDLRAGPRDCRGPGCSRRRAHARGARCEEGEARRAGSRAPVRQRADPRRDRRTQPDRGRRGPGRTTAEERPTHRRAGQQPRCCS